MYDFLLFSLFLLFAGGWSHDSHMEVTWLWHHLTLTITNLLFCQVYAQPCTALHSLAQPPQNASHDQHSLTWSLCTALCTATDESCMSHSMSQRLSHMQGWVICKVESYARLSHTCMTHAYYIHIYPPLSIYIHPSPKLECLGIFVHIYFKVVYKAGFVWPTIQVTL